MLREKKIALVTSAGENIGHATALMMAWAGAKVAVVDRQSKLGQATAQAINDNGSKAIFIEADVSRHNDIRNMVAL